MSVQYRDWLHYVASKSTVYSQELLVQVSIALVSIYEVYYVSQPPSMDGTILVPATTIPARQLSAYASRDGEVKILISTLLLLGIRICYWTD
jgi:hypothetical protein